VLPYTDLSHTLFGKEGLPVYTSLEPSIYDQDKLNKRSDKMQRKYNEKIIPALNKAAMKSYIVSPEAAPKMALPGYCQPSLGMKPRLPIKGQFRHPDPN
jgi:hypothetical protein